MDWKNLSIFGLLALCIPGLFGQLVERTDTLRPTAGEDVNYMMLKLEIPMGETFVRSSSCEGSTICRVSVPDSLTHHTIKTEENGNGTYMCSVSLAPPKPSTPNPNLGANLRLAEQLTDLETYADPEAYKTAFCPDPSLNTDLFVDLGVGASRLDLSGLTLNNVTINTAFADVMVHYNKPNQQEMTQLSIHAASADVVLKNLEQAQARQVVVQNDMGHTKMILGEGYIHGGEISVRSGVGGFTLILDKDQPVELRLKAGFFSEVDLPEGFKEISDGTYINEAVQNSPNDRVIIRCEVDFGKIVIMEM